MLEAVPSCIKNGSHRRRNRLARVMNSALLLLIFYGATCGLVHSHTGILLPDATFGTALGNAREADLTTRLLPSGKDCLLCQFHQQLSHGLFQTPPFALQAHANAVRLLTTAFNNYSAPHDSSRGRAPPLSSLL